MKKVKLLNNNEMQSISAGILDISLNTIARYKQWNVAAVISCNALLSLALYATTTFGRKEGLGGILAGIMINSSFYCLGYGISSSRTIKQENTNEAESQKELQNI